jgi:sugar/nucleoside kinase (ribokinase family)
MPPVFTAIGNACTDLVAKVDEDFLVRHQITKSICGHLKSPEELEQLKSALGSYESFCGGAGANVAHVMSALGHNAHFISKIGDDAEGHYFKKHAELNGVTCHFPAPCPAPLGSTIVMTLITPDSERTFVSYDVAARTMDYHDYAPDILSKTDYLYLDGYCFCSPHTGQSFLRAATEMRRAGKYVTFNIGDISYYETDKSDIDKLLSVCDSIMCNQMEAEIIFGHFSSIDDLVKHLSERFLFGAVTLGADGAIVFYNQKIAKISAIPIGDIADTNGAGDHFSGGFIYGLMNGYTLDQSGKLGALCAADCLSHAGARPLSGYGSLKHLAELCKI